MQERVKEVVTLIAESSDNHSRWKQASSEKVGYEKGQQRRDELVQGRKDYLVQALVDTVEKRTHALNRSKWDMLNCSSFVASIKFRRKSVEDSTSKLDGENSYRAGSDVITLAAQSRVSGKAHGRRDARRAPCECQSVCDSGAK